jgi:hypothetical protein
MEGFVSLDGFRININKLSDRIAFRLPKRDRMLFEDYCNSMGITMSETLRQQIENMVYDSATAQLSRPDVAESSNSPVTFRRRFDR